MWPYDVCVCVFRTEKEKIPLVSMSIKGKAFLFRSTRRPHRARQYNSLQPGKPKVRLPILCAYVCVCNRYGSSRSISFDFFYWERKKNDRVEEESERKRPFSAPLSIQRKYSALTSRPVLLDHVGPHIFSA